MKDLITKLESKVKNCHNTSTIFDTRNYLLLDDVRKILAAINYTDSSLQLKIKEVISFEEWISINKETETYNAFLEGGFSFSLGNLYRKYTMEQNKPLIV